MKTIQQLLDLSKNPHYKLMPDEQRVLDAFLERQRAIRSKKSHGENSNESLEKTPVIVRNIVEKVDTYAPEVNS